MQETISQKIERAAKGFTGDMGEITSCCEKLQKQVAMLEANLHADVAGVELRLAQDTNADLVAITAAFTNLSDQVAAALASITAQLAAQTRLIEALSFQMLPPAVKQVITLGTPVKQ